MNIGDYVLYIPDGDIGKVVNVRESPQAANQHAEPYHIEWHFCPNQSGWHSVYDVDGKQVIILLGGEEQ
jgi:hypothetical protein